MDGARRMTALTLSLLVLPGAGHWYLGRRRAGGVFAALSLMVLLYPLVRYARTTARTFEAMAHAAPDQMPNVLLALHTTWQTEYPSLLLSLGVLAILWIVAAVDIWRQS